MRKKFLPLFVIHFMVFAGNAQTINIEQKLTLPIVDKNHPDRVYDSSGNLRIAIGLHTTKKGIPESLQVLGFQFEKHLGNFLIGSTDTSDIIDIAGHPDVKWIDAVIPQPQMLNDRIRSTQRITYIQSGLNYPGLFGSGVTVGVGDGGDLGQHIDFGDRVTNLGNGTYSSFGQHQDHVSGIIAGAGNINSGYRGIAPEAELITQKTSSINYYIGDYYNDYGMVLTNNSYGSSHSCSSNGIYNYTSSLYDQYMIDYPEVQIVFAAGNSGGNTCGDYPTGYHTVLKYYQSAKNVLTVGNVGKDRIVATKSARGPVKDGRIKPEIMGVGSGPKVWSTGNNNNYWQAGGTSMSSPAVTGTLALMIERYRQLNNGQNPKSGLLKAIACNTADDLGNPHPDFIYGFGLINAKRAIDAIGSEWYESGFVSNGEEKSYTFSAQSGEEQLKILLYWNDLPEDPYPETALINNLDLVVVSPSGDTLFPWVLDPDPLHVSDLATRGVDDLNNIEQVTIDFPETGDYLVKIHGKEITQGNQEFFLSYDRITPEIVITHPAGNEVYEKGSTISVEWDASPLNDEAFIIEYTLNGSLWIPLGTASADQRQFTFELPENLSTAAQIWIRTDSQSATCEPFRILGTTQITSLEDQCDGEVEIFWEADADAIEYTLYQYDGNEMGPVAVTPYNSAQVIAEMGQQHWFAVAPVYPGNYEGGRSKADSLTVQCLTSNLPVVLSEFSGKAEGPKNVIYWMTDTEENTNYFVLERSDGYRNWEIVDTTTASGWSVQPRYYTSDDYSWFRGKTYYRLKIVDYDSSFEHSELISIDRHGFDDSEDGINLFPVPADKSLMIKWDSESSSSKGDIRVYDHLKRMLIRQSVTPGQRAQELDVSNLLPGFYTVQKGRYTQKLVIAKPD